MGRRALAPGRIDEAIQHLSAAARARPDDLELAFEVANLRFRRGAFLDAADEYESLIARNLRNDGPHENLIRTLLIAGRPREALMAAERAYEATRRPEFVSRGLLAANYLDDLSPIDLLERHHRGGRLIAEATGSATSPLLDPRRGGPLRVGLLSGDLVEHPVTRFLEPLMAAIERTRLCIVVFSNTEGSDATTSRLRALAPEWHDLRQVSDEIAAARIRDASLDVLLDLGGHAFSGRPGILARSPAPMTATWLGYPNTTGIPGVDWRIVDDLTDPPDHASATERLLRIEAPFLCYQGPTGIPAGRDLRGDGSIVLGSFNIPAKISPSCIRLWSAAMRGIPGSRLLLKYRGYECPRTRAWIASRFLAEGIEPDRVEFRGWSDGLLAHYAAYAEVDVALDTYPYHGTTTTCDAFWSGVPVVSRIGEDHRSRVGATLLHSVDLPDLASSDDAGFVSAAIALAQDEPMRRRLREQLRDRVLHGPLGDARAFADRLGRALERICGRAGSDLVAQARRRGHESDDAAGVTSVDARNEPPSPHS